LKSIDFRHSSAAHFYRSRGTPVCRGTQVGKHCVRGSALVRQRIEYRVASLVWQCQLGIASNYLIDLCRSVSGIARGRSLRSAGRGVLSVPFSRTTLMQFRAFWVNGPSVWNGLPLELRLLSRTFSDTFYRRLKTVLFDRAGVGSASE